MTEVTTQGNVVEFPKKEEDELVLVCGVCECMTFYLHSSGAVQCSNCKNFSSRPSCDGVEWRKNLPPVPEEEDIKDTQGLVSVHALGSPGVAKDFTIKKIEQWSKNDEVALIAAFSKDGHGQHWAGITNDEQRDWCIRQLNRVIEHISAAKFD